MVLALRQLPRQSLVASIEEQLRDALISGRLRPGDRLNIRLLAQQLGTSPTPVREALIKLAAAGALTAEPGQSFRVPTLTRNEYLEISQIRRAVEGLSAVQATSRISEEEISGLAEIERRFLAAKRDVDVEQALHCNKQFRFTLYEAANMPNLLAIIEGLWLRIGPCFNYLYPQQAIGSGSHHNYDDIISALHRREPEAVRAAVERAIDQGSAILLPHLAHEDQQIEVSRATTTLALP